MRGSPLEGEGLTLDCRNGRGPGGSSPRATWPRCFVYVGDPRSGEMGAESGGELRRGCRHSGFYPPGKAGNSRRGSLESSTGSLVRRSQLGRTLAKPVSLTGLVGSNPSLEGANVPPPAPVRPVVSRTVSRRISLWASALLLSSGARYTLPPARPWPGPRS